MLDVNNGPIAYTASLEKKVKQLELDVVLLKRQLAEESKEKYAAYERIAKLSTLPRQISD